MVVSKAIGTNNPRATVPLQYESMFVTALQTPVLSSLARGNTPVGKTLQPGAVQAINSMDVYLPHERSLAPGRLHNRYRLQFYIGFHVSLL